MHERPTEVYRWVFFRFFTGGGGAFGGRPVGGRFLNFSRSASPALAELRLKPSNTVCIAMNWMRLSPWYLSTSFFNTGNPREWQPGHQDWKLKRQSTRPRKSVTS